MRSLSSLRISVLGAALFVSIAAQDAHAQWNVIQLHGAISEATDVGNAQQVGDADGFACLWNGTPGSLVTLGTAPGFALKTDGVHQVGAQSQHAALWSGTAASFVDLDPGAPTSIGSMARGLSGAVQVGNTNVTSQIMHAAMWMGTAASYVDLNPPGATKSVASDIDGGQIVGYATINGRDLPGLWTGTPSSFTSLLPVGANGGFGAAVHAGRQVGWVVLTSGQVHASAWSSTAASWIDLHPPGALQSVAYDVYAPQVGAPHIAGATDQRACYWNGSASTFVDLQAFLPVDTITSEAFGVWVDEPNQIVYVCGYRTFGDQLYDAWLWRRPISSPIVPYCFGDGSGSPCPCGNNAPLYSGGGCKNHNAVSARLIGQGDPSLSNDTFVLRASSTTNTSTLFFQGTVQQSGGAGSVFGDGLRCASGTVIRLATKTAPAAMQYPDAGDPTVSLRGQIAASGTRTYQAWYRDAASFCTADTFNFTNGLSVTWSP